MRLVELHILQSFPVSCLNRDDVGSPKTAIFGGVTRARISSQCLKRAVRLHAQRSCPNLFAGERSKLIIEPIAKAAEANGAPWEKALEASKDFCHALAKFDEKAFKKGVRKVKTLMFLSPMEREEIGKELARLIAENKDVKNAASKVHEAQLKDAADIALFGRMVASDHSLTLEGAAMFSHALSTHQADNEIDFFAAVDDRQHEDPTVADEDRAGSGMLGTLEYVSAVYYRYVGVNLDLLWNGGSGHLEVLPREEREQVMNAFLRAAITAVPSARHNSMNAHTFPGYVLGLVKGKGQPLQLVNAFEEAVWSKKGLLEPSIKRLKDHHEALKKTWGIEYVCEEAIPEVSLDSLCKKILGKIC